MTVAGICRNGLESVAEKLAWVEQNFGSNWLEVSGIGRREVAGIGWYWVEVTGIGWSWWRRSLPGVGWKWLESVEEKLAWSWLEETGVGRR